MEKHSGIRGLGICCVIAFASVLAGCGEGSSQVSQTTQSSSPYADAGAAISATHSALVSSATDYAPQISGVPARTAVVGRTYSFQPSASVQSSNTALTFSIAGAPSWATFNSKTGLLTGTPTSADVGVDSQILMQVSDGNATVYLAPFTISVVSPSQAGGSQAGGGSAVGDGNVSLAWVAPTENTDGSPLTDLGGYIIHYGNAPMSFTNTIAISNPGITRFVVENLPAGTYYFSVTAVTTDGSQSNYSAEASATIS
jgi:hypothetical protein